MKKSISIILTITLLASCVSSLPVSAAQTEKAKSDDDHISVLTQQINDDNTVTYTDENNNEVDVEALNDSENYTMTMPKSYDLRDYNRSTSVKDQGYEGLCWDFGTTAVMESNILSQPELCKNLGDKPWETLDLSEGGNAWYLFTNFADENSEFYNEYIADSRKGTGGGQPNLIAQGLSSGYGTYPESLMPYENWDNGYSQELRFYSDYRLKNFTVLDKDTNYVKSRINNYGGVTVHYSSFSDNYNIMDGIENYYDNGSSINPNASSDTHLVEIIGWDDNFSKDNFNSKMQPKKDGAWLCKNSWGVDTSLTYNEKYAGYFWMSYETKVYDMTQLEMQSTDAFDNIYQNQIVSKNVSEVSGASNIFTAQSDQKVEQINIATLGQNDYTISLYKLNENYSSPTDGTLLTSFKNSVKTTGCYSVDCPDTVTLQKGDTFSVVVTSDDTLRIDCSENAQNLHIDNRSFLKNQNNEWLSTTREESTVGAPAIKVYTSNINGTDTSKLSKLVNEISSQSFDERIDKDIINSISQELDNAKNLLNNPQTTQQQINNQYCLLNNYYVMINSYFYSIDSMEDYYTLKQLINSGTSIHYISLNTDLDFTDEGIIEPLYNETSFSGKFLGNNHTIKNATIVGSSNFSSFFGKVIDSTIENVSFENIKSSGDDGAAVVASIIKNCKINNISVNNSTVESKKSFVGFISEKISDTTFSNLSIHNCSSKLSTSASIISARIDDNNTYNNNDISDNVLKAVEMVHDSNNGILNVTGNNFAFHSIITLTDNECTVEQGLGVISSVFLDEQELTKTDGKYYIDIKNKNLIVSVNYEDDETANEFSYDIDDDYKSITLVAYLKFDTDLVIPSSIGGIPVKSISDTFTCADFNETETITFPNSIEKIGSYAFNDFANLKSVTFGSKLKSIESGTFKNCPLLHTVKLPSSLTYVGDNCFTNCGFKTVTLDKNIEYIGDNSFGYTSYSGINYEQIKNEDFVINGYKDTAAQNYANTNNFRFVDLDTTSAYENDELYNYSVYLKGDCNKDTEINVIDATLTQKYLAGFVEFDKIQEYNALVDDTSDKITINCVTEIQKIAASCDE